MVYGIAIVAATYASVRLYERYRETRKHSLRNQAGKNTAASTKSIDLTATSGNVLIETDENKKNKHYLTMSGVSIGLSTARIFYPPLTLASILVFTYTAIPYLRQTEKSLIKDCQGICT